MSKAKPTLSPSALLGAVVTPVRRFAQLAAMGALLVCAVAYALVGANLAATALALAGYGLGAVLALALLRRSFAHPTLGLCNAVTLTRLALTAALLAPLLHPVTSPWAVFATAVVALSLDGVDGLLARSEGRASPFGARFDMEVDAALGLILALNIWAAGIAGPWVLALGIPRYLFMAAAKILPWLNRDMPDRFSRKAVCVWQIGALIALQLPILPAMAATPLIATAAAALLWSFGRDTLWLWRHRT
jgi:phosphatidylglycerophosphate synthase